MYQGMGGNIFGYNPPANGDGWTTLSRDVVINLIAYGAIGYTIWRVLLK